MFLSVCCWSKSGNYKLTQTKQISRLRICEGCVRPPPQDQIYADLIAKRIMGGFWNKRCSSGLLQNRTLQSILVTSSFYCLWQWLHGFMARVTKHNTNVLEIMTDTLINLKVHEIKSCYFHLKNILCNLSLEAHTPSHPDDWAVMSSAPWRSRCRRPWTKPCHCVQRGHSTQTEPWVGLGCVCVCVMHVFNYFLLLFPRRNRTARRLWISEPCYRDIFGKKSVFLGLRFLRGMRVMVLFSRCSECVCSMICAVWVAVGHLYHVCILNIPRVCQRKAYVCVGVCVRQILGECPLSSKMKMKRALNGE